MNVDPGAEILGREIFARAGPRTAAHLAECLFQNVLEAAKAAPAATATSPSRTGEALRTEIEAFEVRVRAVTAIAGARPGARTKTFEAAETRFSLRIDLATVERFTLVLVAQQFVCGVQFSKTRGRVGVV